MAERIHLYDDQGRVSDENIAREMAEVEDPYHEPHLRGRSVIPKEKSIREGEQAATERGAELIKLKREQEGEPDAADKLFTALFEGLQKNSALTQRLEQTHSALIDCVKRKQNGDISKIVFLDPNNWWGQLTVQFNPGSKNSEITVFFPIPGQHEEDSWNLAEIAVKKKMQEYSLKDLALVIQRINQWAGEYGAGGVQPESREELVERLRLSQKK